MTFSCACEIAPHSRADSLLARNVCLGFSLSCGNVVIMARVVQRRHVGGNQLGGRPEYRDMLVRLGRGFFGSKHPAGEHAL